MKQMYPVIFTQTKDAFLIEVPDLEILTQGCDLSNAFDMARDAISITIVSLEDAGEPIPLPSKFEAIDAAKGTFANEGESFTSLVDCDISAYRRKVDTKPVRRNVSLPSWLNSAADAAGINVSRVLQDALKNELHITDYHPY